MENLGTFGKISPVALIELYQHIDKGKTGESRRRKVTGLPPADASQDMTARPPKMS